MRIRFKPEAEAELVEARAWYSLQRQGLDAQLMMRVDEALQRIIQAPEAYPTIHGQVRRAVIRQFPFAIFYELTAAEIRVVAVFHSRRDPKRLKSRT